jgi:hypothetical protein
VGVGAVVSDDQRGKRVDPHYTASLAMLPTVSGPDTTTWCHTHPESNARGDIRRVGRD